MDININKQQNTPKRVHQTGSPELRAKLGRGAITEIARVFNVSKTWAERVVSGKREGSPMIIEYAIKLAEHETRRKKIMAAVSERNERKLKKLSV